ncbi:MAG: hydrogenase iron-sulfur subunit [Thermoproteota archaeon]|nr:hydrogenase iron-sulfur subunit [Thermoproteota archaeon]
MSFEEPKIVCFLCNWVFCDIAETKTNQTSQIPPNVNVARVMCIGRVDPVVVLETFEKGADGVLLVGCTPPDCHFVEGNLYAEYTVKMLKNLLGLIGLEPERLDIRWHSPIEEVKFIHLIKDFTAQIQKFGSSPLAGQKFDEKVLLNVLAAKNAAEDFRLRVLTGRERELTEDFNVYGEKIPQEEFDALLDEIIKAEFIRHKIHLLTKEKPLSVKEIATITNMKPALVLRHIVNMRRKGMITLDHVERTTPLYKALEVQ